MLIYTGNDDENYYGYNVYDVKSKRMEYIKYEITDILHPKEGKFNHQKTDHEC